MIITDKMIEDIRSVMNNTKPSEMHNLDILKKKIIEKGYEVEEKKSKLDEAREYISMSSEAHTTYATFDHDMISIKYLYEQAIKELQEQKPKIDDDLIEWLDGVKCSFHSTGEEEEYAGRLLKQLGIK